MTEFRDHFRVTKLVQTTEHRYREGMERSDIPHSAAVNSRRSLEVYPFVLVALSSSGAFPDLTILLSA